eukprot:TRINITY_DN5218_c0_g1_i15.p1 TRINITY_DN5218_c0_g1~~TRINITY_DN5218_c0_g1_i15.p1  ORF type:complete len:815 (-),score=268.51 TRINITY_DN5218_c0_g1_i15:1544-3988(-)
MCIRDSPKPTPSTSGDLLFIYIRASHDRIMLEAEQAHIDVDMDPSFGYDGDIPFPTRPKGLESFPTAPFSIEGYRMGQFGPVSEGGFLFMSAIRCQMIDNILRKNSKIGGAGLYLDQMVFEEKIKFYTPLHDLQALNQLRERWLPRWWQWWWAELAGRDTGHVPGVNRLHLINDVRDYYGEQTAFYFAFLGFYSFCMLPLSLISIPIYIAQLATNDENWGMVLWTVSLSLWTACFLKLWKRRSAELRYDWDLEEDQALGYKKKTRPQFVAPVEPGFYSEGGWVDLSAYENVVPNKYAETPGKWSQKFMKGDGTKSNAAGTLMTAHYKVRGWWQLLNCNVILFCVCMLLCVSVVLLVFKIWSNNLGEYGSVVGGAVNGLSIQILNFIFNFVAKKLTDMENHRTQQEHENSLIAKLFGFQFVNNYGTLFYIAFVKPYGEVDHIELWPTTETDFCIRARDSPLITEEHRNCYSELRSQYMGILLSKIFVDAIVDLVLPWVLRKWNAYSVAGLSVCDAITGTSGEGEAEHCQEDELVMAPYASSIDDFNQLILTFGFVVLFGVAWPVGTLVIAAYGIVQNAVDSYKLCWFCQRPLSKEQDDIGAWGFIIQIIGMVGVVTNTAILAYTMDWFSEHYDVSNEQKLWAFIFTEHAILALYLLIQLMFNDEPSKLQQKMALDLFEEENYQEGNEHESPPSSPESPAAVPTKPDQDALQAEPNPMQQSMGTAPAASAGVSPGQHAAPKAAESKAAPPTMIMVAPAPTEERSSEPQQTQHKAAPVAAQAQHKAAAPGEAAAPHSNSFEGDAKHFENEVEEGEQF